MDLAGEGSPLNRGAGLGLSGPVTRTDLEFVERFYAGCGAPPRVDLCPLADPSLLDLLKSGGYHLEEFFSVLVRALAEEAVPAPPPAEIRTSRAGPTEAELWIATVAQGFGDAEIPAHLLFCLAGWAAGWRWSDLCPRGGSRTGEHQHSSSLSEVGCPDGAAAGAIGGRSRAGVRFSADHHLTGQ